MKYMVKIHDVSGAMDRMGASTPLVDAYVVNSREELEDSLRVEPGTFVFSYKPNSFICRPRIGVVWHVEMEAIK